MNQQQSAGALVAALWQHRCGTVPELMRVLEVANGAALLARLDCAGNHAALWEALTYEVARRLLPDDDLAPLIADWFPHPAAMQEFGARALAAGADPADPALPAEAKGRILVRLSRPSQVAFETYALAREAAVAVSAGLRAQARSDDTAPP